MIRELILTSLFIAALLVVFRFRYRIAAAVRRFDDTNIQRIKDQEAERADPLAHFKHTLRAAEEQVEDVSELTLRDVRLGTPVTRYVFEGQYYATREEADFMRAEKIRAIARNYYRELPVALAEPRAQPAMKNTPPPEPPKPPPPQQPVPPGSNVIPLRRNGETLH